MATNGNGSMRDKPLSFGDFIVYIERELGIELPRASGDLIIGVDFELDSVEMLEAVVAIEDLGAELPADLFLTANSLAEVYAQYLRAIGAGQENAGVISPPSRA